PTTIREKDLREDGCDIQGIDWTKLGIRRKQAREEKSMHFINGSRQTAWYRSTPPINQVLAENKSGFLKFRRMNTGQRPYINHYQLRNALAVTSNSDIYYARKHQIYHTDPTGQREDLVVDFTVSQDESINAPRWIDITSIAAVPNVLLTGGFCGDYSITNLASTLPTGHTTTGMLSPNSNPATNNAIVNFIDIFHSRRSSSPTAAIGSNDCAVRILDCATNTITDRFDYPVAVNCVATSPSGRLRCLATDVHPPSVQSSAVITDAESGKPLQILDGHRSEAFACAWADNEIHVATGAQDSFVRVYDARWWKQPLVKICTNMAPASVLKFSPGETGKRVLLVAEAADYLEIVDAESWDQKQTVDFFGRPAGIGWCPDGATFTVAVEDGVVGGLMQFGR
ncbi:WD40 repeat-like protein, partial [Aulographum hederae CBS 113979]